MAESDRMVRVGAVDCGTNSIRLLVADVDRATGALTDVLRRMEIVRLGYGVDRTGRIDPVAMQRTLAMSHEYADQCASLGAESVRFAATSASRDASNAAEFVVGVREAFARFGTSPEVITGDEEAARSVDIGCVRMTERYLHSDPPTADEIAAATVDIEAAVAVALQAVPAAGVRTLVGLAGSVTTVTAQAWSLPTYDPRRIHLAVTPVERMRQAARDLLAMNHAHRAALPFMHPGRVDVIGAGALVWDVVIREVAERSGRGSELTVVSSEHDILDGLALSQTSVA